MDTFDVAVIGSGPGGYVAAIRCAQLGFKTALIEKYNALGGTCLNVGCIPSKALLDSSEHYYNLTHKFAEHGINSSDVSLDFKKMIARKTDVINKTVEGIRYLMDKNKISVFKGLGRFKDTTHIDILSDDKKTQTIEAKYTIIATGSKPASLPFAKIDKKRIISSTEALSLPEIPKKLIVVGGGVIGLELGSVYSRLGTEVTVVEYFDRIAPTMDAAISKELLRTLKKQGIKFELSTGVTEVIAEKNKVILKAKNAKGTEINLEADYCLISVGRYAYTEGLGLENVDISADEKGRIQTNEKLQTKQPNIYAIGDVVQGAMLAHKASEEGVFVAETIAGQKPHIDYNLIPSVIYTWPEVASVGKTEEELKAAKVDYKTGQFPMRALGRARASGDLEGLVKLLADKNTDEILGLHIIGARAADIIGEAVVAMEFRASAEDIARISHAHPTFTEALKEAALAADKIAIHS